MWEKMKGKILEINNRPIKAGWVITIAAASILLVLITFFLGFRITYSPNLENSWDAISAFAAWAGVGASLGAIWAAIQIPKKIAEEQNKITLFEKRYTFYETLYKCMDAVDMLKKVDNNEVAQRYVIITFLEDATKGLHGADYQTELSLTIQKMMRIFEQGEFLFEFETQLYVKALGRSLSYCLRGNFESEDYRKVLSATEGLVKDIRKDLVPRIKEALKLEK